ncbi:hypothetical protein C6501_17960 [Candidatus Poribacteria bacterium]|nr:MAG: hypothetical protein C6501_17960 [Candidatus Poribacteria bacterium]
MKTLLAFLILFYMIALPALGELTTQDLEKIRQIVKESETALKADMKELETALKADMKESETALKADMKELETALKADIEKITSKLDTIDTRLRTVETGVAELRGRNIGVSVLKDWLVVLCAVAAVIISIIALRKKQSTVSPTTQAPKKAASQ